MAFTNKRPNMLYFLFNCPLVTILDIQLLDLVERALLNQRIQ